MTRPNWNTSQSNLEWPNQRYAWYVTIVLMVLYIFSFIDRTILALLVGPIKAELGVTDTQFGLLYGLAFSLFYTVLGVPIGLLADNKNRRNIIAVGVALWGMATALCGLAGSFAHLFIARMAVGVGEATLSPAATSMLSDYFPPEKRTKALGVYSMGLFLGVGTAILFGGIVIQLVSNMPAIDFAFFKDVRPWQTVFIIVGLPGPFLALLVFLTVREPARKEKSSQKKEHKTSFKDFIKFLKKNRSPLFNHYFGFSLLVLYAYSFTAWSPALFGRNFDLSNIDVGLYYGVAVLIGSSTGILTGGWYANAMRAKRQLDANMRIGVYSAVGVLIAGVSFPLMPSLELALVGSCIAQFFIAAPFGAAPAALFDITPNQFRAQAAAVYYFFINIIGLTCGPLAVGLLTDYVFQDELALGYSMALVCAFSSILGGFILWRGLPSLSKKVNLANFA